jgi:hypothetical protein
MSLYKFFKRIKPGETQEIPENSQSRNDSIRPQVSNSETIINSVTSPFAENSPDCFSPQGISPSEGDWLSQTTLLTGKF